MYFSYTFIYSTNLGPVFFNYCLCCGFMPCSTDLCFFSPFRKSSIYIHKRAVLISTHKPPFLTCCKPSAMIPSAYLLHHVVPPGSSKQTLILHASLILHDVKAAENHVHVWRAKTLHHIFYMFSWITLVFMCESGFNTTSEFIMTVKFICLCNMFCAAAETTSGSAVIHRCLLLRFLTSLNVSI